MSTMLPHKSTLALEYSPVLKLAVDLIVNEVFGFSAGLGLG